MSRSPVAIFLAIVCATLALLSAFDPHARAWLDYSREALTRGEIWRLATAHLVHLSAAHATLDIAALLLVAWIFGRTLRTGQLVALLLVAMAAIDAGLWWLSPEVDRYAGLSGVLHGWFAAGATRWMLTPVRVNRSAVTHASGFARRTWGAALLAGLVVKLALESGGRAFWLADAGFPVVTAAHRWGAAAGVACALVISVIDRRAAAAAASRPR